MKNGIVPKRTFERMVWDAISALPKNIRDAMKNVAFVVEDAPSRRDLLGLYHGVPHTKRGAGYSMVLPDKITVYKNIIESEARNASELRGLVRMVVWHEIGHHLGFDEKEIRRLERRWKRSGKLDA